jgi:hypothetical protein
MRDPGHRLCFGEEADQELGIVGEAGVEELDGDGPLEAVVVRAPDLGVAPLTEGRVEDVAILDELPRVHNHQCFFPMAAL